MQPHADADRGETRAPVGVVLSEEMAHHVGTSREQRQRDGGGEGGDRQQRHADRAREGVVTRRRLQAGQVGQERGLDRLEELQRGARDQQHLEHDAHKGLVGRGRRHGEHGSVQQRLLGEHDPRYPAGEAGPAP